MTGITDVNVYQSRWPTRRLHGDDILQMEKILAEKGVSEAWISSFDGLLHKDIGGVNQRLYDDCKMCREVKLKPFGVINPVLPDWQEDVLRCALKWKMPGVRLFPNYHGYSLDDTRFVDLLKFASERSLIISISLQLEDERMMHRLLRVPPVDPAPLVEAFTIVPNARVLLLNAKQTIRSNTAVQQLIADRNLYIDTAMLEGLGAISQLLTSIPLEKILFGSNAPLFYFQAAILKLTESDLDRWQIKSIQQGSAQQLLQISS